MHQTNQINQTNHTKPNQFDLYCTFSEFWYCTMPINLDARALHTGGYARRLVRDKERGNAPVPEPGEAEPQNPVPGRSKPGPVRGERSRVRRGDVVIEPVETPVNCCGCQCVYTTTGTRRAVVLAPFQHHVCCACLVRLAQFGSLMRTCGSSTFSLCLTGLLLQAARKGPVRRRLRARSAHCTANYGKVDKWLQSRSGHFEMATIK